MSALSLTISVPAVAARCARRIEPPSVAPVLMLNAEPGSYVAELSWTHSNRVMSPGFAYKVFSQYLANAPSEIVGATLDDFLAWEESSGDGSYTYWVIPYNDAGEGPSSNAASIALPGESDAPDLTGAYLTPDAAFYYTNPDSSLFYHEPITP